MTTVPDFSADVTAACLAITFLISRLPAAGGTTNYFMDTIFFSSFIE
jgi:hypothetical protein